MQLSSSTASADSNLAALFVPGDTPPAAAGLTAGEGAGAFAQLFPDLASASTPLEKKSIAPTAGGTMETMPAWTISIPPPPVKLTGLPDVDLSTSAAVTGELELTGASGATGVGETVNLRGGVFQAAGRRLGIESPRAAAFAARTLPSATLSVSNAVSSATPGDDPTSAKGTETLGPAASRLSGKSRLASSTAETAAASGRDTLAASTNAAPQQTIPPAPAVESFVAPTPSALVSQQTATSDRPDISDEPRPRISVSGSRSQPTIPTASDFSGPANPAGFAAAPAPGQAGVPLIAPSYPILAGDVASRFLAPTVAPSSSPASQVADDAASPAVAGAGVVRTASDPAVAEIVAQLAPADQPAPPTAPHAFEPAAVSPIRDLSSAGHSETSLGGRGEKFASPEERIGLEKNLTTGALDKTFLNTSDKRVTSSDGSLGTDVAKDSTAMSAATFFHPATAAVLEHVPVPEVTAARTEFSTLPAQPSAAEITGAAHRAVEAVLTAAERFSAGDRHAVNLQFSVGGADLTVRVEMRADEVRTMFRTDSPELRAALAQEWQAVNSHSNAGDRTLRLTTPVFSSNDNGNLSAFSGDSAPRQRESGARRDVPESFAIAAPSARTSRFAPPALAEAAPRAASSPTMLHLHALA